MATSVQLVMPDHTRWSGITENLLPADDVIHEHCSWF